MTGGPGDKVQQAVFRGRARQRLANRAVLLRILRRDGPMTRQELARRGSLSVSTVAALVTELELTGLVRQQPVSHGRSGRRPFVVAFNHSAGTALAVDIGARHVAVAVGSRSQAVHAERRMELPLRHDPRAAERLVGALTQQVLADSETDPETLLGAAIAVSGVGASDYRVRPVPGESGVAGADDIARMLEHQWQVPAVVESRARLGALAEFSQGRAQGAYALLNITCESGVGIGLGIVLGGRLLRGSSGAAGSIGHLVVHPGGRPCRCGGRGCLDAYIGEPSPWRTAGQGPDISSAAPADDIALLARAVADVALVIDPSVVVLGGALAGLGDPFVDCLRSGLRAVPALNPDLPVLRSALGENASLLGGLDLVLSRFDHATPPAGRIRTQAKSGTV